MNPTPNEIEELAFLVPFLFILGTGAELIVLGTLGFFSKD